MKRFILYFLLVGYFGFTQITPSGDLDKFGRINLGLHGLELSYELPLSNSFV